MEMEQLEAMRKVFSFEHLSGRQQFGRAQAELRVFAAALSPLARSFAQQPRPNTDAWLDTKLLRDGDDLPQFLQFLDHHDNFLAELRAQQSHPNEIGILVTVANDQAPDLTL